ncbi:MAG: acylphosphatase [Verrucomicrobia bacterium]|nr:MAG: acylphosphatase [Verrucomicrobiota bacterium]
MTVAPTVPRRLVARFEGHVQGIGFRYTAVGLATRLGVTGYVANLMNGDVELVAEGPEERLLELVQQIQRSHLDRYILRVQQHWLPATGEFTDFDVRFGV